MREPLVAVIGPGDATPAQEQQAEAIGHALAQAGVAIVTGGLGGVMAAACRGAADGGGTTLGLLPGDDPADANPWVRFAVPTGMGELRNGLVVRAAAVVVAIGGAFGTLSELALAARRGTPIVGLGTWPLETVGIADPVLRVDRPDEAVTAVLDALGWGTQ